MRHPHRAIVGLIGTIIVIAGCPTGGVVTGSSGPAVSIVPAASGEPAASQPAAGGGNGSLPSDPCQLVTEDDVTAIYGGSVTALGLDENNGCAFEIEGVAKAGKSPGTGEFAVSFGDEWSTYEDVKVVFGDSLVKVEGLGTEAYSWGGFTHAKVGAGELVVGGVFIGDYDRPMLEQETFEMTKLLLSRT